MKNFDLASPSGVYFFGAIIAVAIIFNSPLSFIVWGAIKMLLLFVGTWYTAFRLNRHWKTEFWGWVPAGLGFLYAWGWLF